MSDDKQGTIRILSFTGKKDDWVMWSQKFIALAGRKGFREILTGETQVPKKNAVYDETETGKKNSKANVTCCYAIRKTSMPGPNSN